MQQEAIKEPLEHGLFVFEHDENNNPTYTDRINKTYVKFREDLIKYVLKAYRANTEKDFKNNVIKLVTSVAAITRDKDKSKNPENRFYALCREAAPDPNLDEITALTTSAGSASSIRNYTRVPGRPLEYFPVVLTIDLNNRGLSTNFKTFENENYLAKFLYDRFTFTYHTMCKKDILLNIYKYFNSPWNVIIEDTLNYNLRNVVIVLTNLRHMLKLTEIAIKEERGCLLDVDFSNEMINSVNWFLDNFIPIPEYLTDSEEENRYLRTTVEKFLNYFIIMEAKVPYFSFAQLRTHGLLSQLAVSNRVVENDILDYWLPYDLPIRVGITESELKNMSITDYANVMLNHKSDLIKNQTLPTAVEELKKLGYKKEIYERFYNHLINKRFILAGWLNNPHQWPHFLLERGGLPTATGTQKTTAMYVKAMRKLIKNRLT